MTPDSSSHPLTIFSPRLVDQVGDIGKVLGEFLDSQKSIIQGQLESQFTEIGNDSVQKILNAFITLEGTKRPLRKNQIQVANITEEELDSCLDLLEKSRILRYEDGLYELAHDTLALRISEDRSAAEVAYLEVIKLITDRFRLFDSTKTLLNANELLLVKGFESRLNREQALSKAQWSFVNKSRREVGRKKTIFRTVITVVILILASTTIFSLQQRSIAKQQQEEAVKAQQVAEDNLQRLTEEQALRTKASYNQHLASGKTLMNQSEYVLAIQEFDLALTFDPEGEEAVRLKQESLQLSNVRQQFESLIQQGDALYARGDNFLIDARNRYLSARNLGYQNVLADSKITTVDGKLPAAFDKFVRNGDTFKRVNNCDRALENYRKALRIRPDDQALRAKISECGG